LAAVARSASIVLTILVNTGWPDPGPPARTRDPVNGRMVVAVYIFMRLFA